METTTSKFVKEVTARQKNDGNTFDPLAIEKKALSALEAQIKGLTFIEPDLANNLVKAQANLDKVIYITHDISNPKGYIEKIADAQVKLNEAEAAWDEVKKQIDFFTKLKKDRF